MKKTPRVVASFARIALVSIVVAGFPTMEVGASGKKKAPTTTTQPKAKVRFVWMCSLATQIDMNVIPGLTPTDYRNPFQQTGNASDWRTEDLKAAAKVSSNDCQVFYSGEKTWVQSVWLSQAFKKTEGFFLRAPSWNPNYKWIKTRVDGITAETWTRKNGRYRARNNVSMPPACEVGVNSPRGVFRVQWLDSYSEEVDESKVECGIAEEVMRRLLAGLEAGGYEYIT